MSRIDDLITKHCPAGVEHRPLGGVGEFIRGQGLQKKDLLDEGVPAIHYGQIHTHYGVWATETKSFTSASVAEKLRHAEPGDLLIATTSEDDEAVAKATAWLGESSVVLSGDAYIYRHELDPRYVAYFFQTEQFQNQKRRFITGTKVRRVSGASLAKVVIPVPPLEVQQEIAGVLDAFAALEAELEAELEARHRQYAIYRDALLTFAEAGGSGWVPLGELATIVRGASPRPIQSFLTGAEHGVPWIKIGDVGAGDKFITRTAQYVTSAGAQKSRRVHPGDFVMSNSMSFGRPYISKIEGCIHDGWLSISDFSESFVSDFLYHLLRSKAVQSELSRRASSGTVQNLNADIVKSVVVPVPPLDEQRRIAEVLDKFDALVNDLSSGLPAELQARRKQYEHYRDRLLSFDEAVA